MKGLKIALGIALSTVGVGSGVAIGVSNFAGNSESYVKAATDGYVLTVNSFSYKEDYEFTKVDGEYQLLGVELNNGDFFTIYDKTDKYEYLGWENLDDGNAKPFFDEYYDSAIVCGAASTFNIYLNSFGDITINLAQESTVYVQLQDGTTSLYVWDEISDSSYKYEPLGGWPGQTLESVSGDANFNHAGGIAKVTFPIVNTENTKVIVKYNDSQTGNLDLVDGGYYYNNAGEGLKYLGDAAEVVIQIVDEIKKASDSSICNISSSRAGELYNLYNGLSADAKGAVNNSTLWTYKSKDMSEGYADISFVDITNRLSMLSSKGSSSNFILPLKRNEYGMAILVSIISVFSISVIAFFVIKRKRHQ